jgi:hypothetical protein
MTAEMEGCMSSLKQEWGEQTQVNIMVAAKTLHQIFGPDTAMAVENAGLGRHPGFIKALHKIGNRSLEELGIDKRGTALKTPSDLDGEITSLMAHPAYMDKKHPEHNILVNKVQALFQRRYPGEAKQSATYA